MIRSQEQIDQVTELYTAGLSTRQIAERIGISKSLVGSIIKRAGIGRDRSISQTLGCRRSTRTPFEWSFFPLSAEKAWLLGLIYGDGSLRNDGLRITITSGDRDVIENINALFENALGFRVRPSCMRRYKPKGRTYRCPACGFVAHRDAVGCANILSKHYTGEPGHVLPAQEKYRYPFWGKRSRLDTAEMVWVPTGRAGRTQEAAPF